MADHLYHRKSADLPELTFRAVLTGMAIGALLTPCNVYSGLKIGWTFNMSVAAGLIGFGFWTALHSAAGTRAYGLYENNINQTAASSAASIISAGLAAPVPALALLTGQTLSFPILAVWLFVVSVLGIVVAAGLRNQLLYRDRLPFPAGVVTAETMGEIHSGSPEAPKRLRLLSFSAAMSALLKIANTGLGLGPLAPAIKVNMAAPAAPGGAVTVTPLNLGLALDPSVLMFGFGAISGLRIGVSALVGAALAWLFLAPWLLRAGWVAPGADDPDVLWFGPLVEWLLWPGATLMVTASLTSFALSLLRMALRRREQSSAAVPPECLVPPSQGQVVQNRYLAAGFFVAMAMCVAAQTSIFEIGIIEATLAVLLSYVLAIVAARVSGETAITPIGALGKITQFTFGIVSPGNVSANLMTANVTGGAAGQCADLMHDLRTGQLIGATPGFQIVAQIFGVLTGSLVASITYLLLIPDPQGQLITAEWPAPAVATWKAVAEVMSEGLDAMPTGTLPAILLAMVVGISLALIESLSAPSVQRYVPSASAIGLGFVIPAYNSISLCAGAATAALITWLFPEWAKRRLIVVAAGLIVGESLAGVADSLSNIAR